MLNTPSAFLPPPEQTVFHLSAQLPDGVRLTPQRQRVLSFLQSAPPLPLADLSREVGVSTSVIKGLADDGALIRSSQPRLAAPHRGVMPSGAELRANFTLTSAQQHIADGIDRLADSFSVHLIDGITGSGKTEVYFDQVVKQVAAGKQVLILLPEIALTTSWKARLKNGSAMRLISGIHLYRRRGGNQSGGRQYPASLWLLRARARLCFCRSPALALSLWMKNMTAAINKKIMSAIRLVTWLSCAQKCTIFRCFWPARHRHWKAGYMQGAAESWLQLTGPLRGHSSWHHWPLTSRYGSAHLPQVSLIDLRLSKPEAGKWLSAEMMEAVMARLEAGEQSCYF